MSTPESIGFGGSTIEPPFLIEIVGAVVLTLGAFFWLVQIPGFLDGPFLAGQSHQS
jgi:hypothetical protein